MAEMFDQVQSLRRALDYHIKRANVLASNVANADTPGFKPRELTRELPENNGGMRMRRTANGHVGPSGIADGHERISVRIDKSSAAGLDGNAVNIEREMSKISANDVRYETAAKLVSRHIAMIRYAAQDGR